MRERPEPAPLSAVDESSARSRFLRVLVRRSGLLLALLASNLRLTHALPAEWRRR